MPGIHWNGKSPEYNKRIRRRTDKPINALIVIIIFSNIAVGYFLMAIFFFFSRQNFAVPGFYFPSVAQLRRPFYRYRYYYYYYYYDAAVATLTSEYKTPPVHRYGIDIVRIYMFLQTVIEHVQSYYESKKKKKIPDDSFNTQFTRKVSFFFLHIYVYFEKLREKHTIYLKI